MAKLKRPFIWRLCPQHWYLQRFFASLYNILNVLFGFRVKVGRNVHSHPPLPSPTLNLRKTITRPGFFKALLPCMSHAFLARSLLFSDMVYAFVGRFL